ncbi:MAG: type IV toxin-antitoxin system AbiEi family antitoxin domain-containing protein [Thermoleophilia bacterium]|nr:type IV toxin-antitoxin system AbiEi family antitoxin domain-containing protein [Thermoleophilia bacterium]
MFVGVPLRASGGARTRLLRTGEALRFRIHPRTLYAMRDSEALERLSRGVYGLAAKRPPVSS